MNRISTEERQGDMCSVCYQNPCHPRCPNAPEPKPVIVCVRCEEGIFAGDKYYESGEGPICEECMDGMRAGEILELFGEEMITAEGDD